MSGGKETPRQKMIGMMYLVLTALLAMNVADQVLDAFKIVNDGLVETNGNFTTKNDYSYSAFDGAMKNNPEKTKPFYDKALLAKKYCGDLYKYIEDLKQQLIVMGDGLDENGDIVERKNLDKSGELFMTRGKGKELKGKILDTRKKILELVDPKDRASFSISLNAVDPKPGDDGIQTWESHLFEHPPLTASVTLLSKLQNDVKNAEGDILNYLLKSIDADDFKFDRLVAVVVPKSSYVLVGQPYEAEVFITAYDSKKNPDIIVGGRALPVEDGKGKYKVIPGTENPKVMWGGVINVKSPDGTTKKYDFKSEYQVAKPSAVVSADKMNVFYIGVPNPVSISAPGIPKEKVKVRISSGSITGNNGKYEVRVQEQGKVTITVLGEFGPNDVKPLGTYEYRVKKIPPPIAKFGGVASGSLGSGLVKAQQGLFAVLENFDFDTQFIVTKFTMTLVKARQDPVQITTDGPALTQEMKSSLASVGPRDKLFFDEIYVKGPDGRTTRLETGVTISIR